MTNPSDVPHQLRQASASTLIDDFVEHIERSSEPALILTNIGQFLLCLERMFDFATCEDADAVGERLRTFREACLGIGIEFSPLGITCLDESESRYLCSEEAVNLLVKRIRDVCSLQVVSA